MIWGWANSVLALGSSKLLGMIKKALNRQLKTKPGDQGRALN